MIWLYVIVFIISCFLLFWSGSKLVRGLIKMAEFLNWREFVVAFFIMAIAASVPNFFVGVNSAIHGIPQLSFGDIVGQNMIDMTLAVALAVLIGGTALPAKSKMVQTSTIFTVAIAVLPLFLILDGFLGRVDALILLFTFGFYISWLFSKKERFRKVYTAQKLKEEKKPIIEYKHTPGERWKVIEHKILKQFKSFFKGLKKVIVALILLLIASEGIVRSSRGFADALDITVPVVGILIVAVGNAIPETYFAVAAARKKRTWMILGDLMGSVIICSTFVLGIVALISPIEITDFSLFAIARIFLVISALFFLIVVKTDQKITKKEGLFLLLIYLLFLISVIFFR